MKKRTIPLFYNFLLLVVLNPISGYSWWTSVHSILTHAAVRASSGLPEFFRKGESTVAFFSEEPDIIKTPTTVHLRKTEAPEHYFDRELLTGNSIPETRQEFFALCSKTHNAPDRIGMLPYAVTEWTERLAVSFAQYRKWPSNPDIQTSCLVYAGYLSHYAQDLCQPLHTTVDFDGRTKSDGSSPHSGIHDTIDGIIETLHLTADSLLPVNNISVYKDLPSAVRTEIDSSGCWVDSIYNMDKRSEFVAGKDVRNFAVSREKNRSDLQPHFTQPPGRCRKGFHLKVGF